MLERATAFIHEVLLKNDPNFRTASFTIETRKIVSVREVPYEVDVFVTPTKDSPYLGTVIFECKDWKTPVQRAQISELDTKVEALGASKGIMVARSITKGARTLIEQKTRLSFVQCSDDFQSPLDNMEFVHIWHDFFPLKISIFERGSMVKENSTSLDYKKSNCSLNGKSIKFASYIDDLLNEIVRMDKEQNYRTYTTDSNHWRQEVFEISYEPKEFLIDGQDIQKMQIASRYCVEVQQQKIMSKFELDKQGRAFFFEAIVDSKTGDKHEIEIVQLL